MKRFTVVSKDDQVSLNIATTIKHALLNNNWEETDKFPSLIITVGGDGTFLRAVHQYLNQLEDVSFVGIHTGTLGFFTDYEADEVHLFIDNVINNNAEIEKIRLLKVVQENTIIQKPIYAVNEIRVENILKTQSIEVYIEQEYLETFKGNGLCVSAQAGSSAYNRSIAGAVLSVGIEALQLTEISGIHHKASRSLGSPLIVAPQTKILFKSESFSKAMLCYDHLQMPMDHTKNLTITLSDKTVKMARYRPTSYIRRLHSLF